MMMVIARQSHLRGQNLRFTFECNNPYLPTYLPTYIPTYLPTYRHTYIHTYVARRLLDKPIQTKKINRAFLPSIDLSHCMRCWMKIFCAETKGQKAKIETETMLLFFVQKY